MFRLINSFCERKNKQIFVTPNLIFFCDFKPPAKYRNPTIIPSERKVSVGERKRKEREKKTLNSGQLVP
jgi:hypothetical protein